jgi:hypothetical protein
MAARARSLAVDQLLIATTRPGKGIIVITSPLLPEDLRSRPAQGIADL